MKKLIAGSILLLLCLAGIGWSQIEENHWYGYVYDKDTEQPVENARVTTSPSDGLDYTSSTGKYNLLNENGMDDGEYYTWINALKGVKQGSVAVNDYYWEADPAVQRDIWIEVPPGK